MIRVHCFQLKQLKHFAPNTPLLYFHRLVIKAMVLGSFVLNIWNMLMLIVVIKLLKASTLFIVQKNKKFDLVLTLKISNKIHTWGAWYMSNSMFFPKGK